MQDRGTHNTLHTHKSEQLTEDVIPFGNVIIISIIICVFETERLQYRMGQKLHFRDFNKRMWMGRWFSSSSRGPGFDTQHHTSQSRSRGSKVLFWPLSVPHACAAQTYIQAKDYTHKIKINKIPKD